LGLRNSEVVAKIVIEELVTSPPGCGTPVAKYDHYVTFLFVINSPSSDLWARNLRKPGCPYTAAAGFSFQPLRSSGRGADGKREPLGLGRALRAVAANLIPSDGGNGLVEHR